MLKYFVLDEKTGETHDDFAARVNAEIDALRDANLVVNYTPIPGGSPTIYAQVGADEPIVQNGQLVGMRFKDLSTAEVTKKLDARKAAMARGPSGVITPHR